MIPIYDLIPAPASGAATRARAAATRLKKATDEPRRAVMFAKDLVVNADREYRARRDALDARLSERDAVMAEIAATKARLASLKADILPTAERAVVAAQARLEALADDVQRASQIADAQAIIDADSAR